MAAKSKRTFKVRVLAWIAYIVFNLLGWVTRFTFRNAEVIDSIRAKGEWPLFAFWHGRQFMIYYPFRIMSFVVPASLSKDGEIFDLCMRRAGHIMVRGSSSKRAVGLLLELIREVKKGHPSALSVDGPRGPYREAKMGIIKVAQKTGFPIVPVAASARRPWISRKSWDNFMLPKPFTRVMLQYGEPIYVDRDASKADLETCRDRLQHALEQGLDEVDELCGHPGLEHELRKAKSTLGPQPPDEPETGNDGEDGLG